MSDQDKSQSTQVAGDREHGPASGEERSSGSGGGAGRDRSDRGGPPRGGVGGRRPYYRRKVDRTKNLDITYRKPEILERFVTQSGKILPRRITGTSAKNQRRLARQIKLARVLALLPFATRDRRPPRADAPG